MLDDSSGANAGTRENLLNQGPLSVITSVSCTKVTEKAFIVVMFLFGTGKNLRQACLFPFTSSRITVSSPTQRESSRIGGLFLLLHLSLSSY